MKFGIWEDKTQPKVFQDHLNIYSDFLCLLLGIIFKGKFESKRFKCGLLKFFQFSNTHLIFKFSFNLNHDSWAALGVFALTVIAQRAKISGSALTLLPGSPCFDSFSLGFQSGIWKSFSKTYSRWTKVIFVILLASP